MDDDPRPGPLRRALAWCAEHWDQGVAVLLLAVLLGALVLARLST